MIHSQWTGSRVCLNVCVGLRGVGKQPPAAEKVHNLITARRVKDMDSNYCK